MAFHLHPGRSYGMAVGVPPSFPMGAQPASRMNMGPPTSAPFTANRVVNQTIGWTTNARTTWASVVQPDKEGRNMRFMPGELLFLGKDSKSKFASPSSVAMFDLYGINKLLSEGNEYRVGLLRDADDYNDFANRKERMNIVLKFLNKFAFEGVLVNGTAATDGDESRVGDRLVNLVVRGHALSTNIWGFPIPAKTPLYFGVFVPNTDDMMYGEEEDDAPKKKKAKNDDGGDDGEGEGGGKGSKKSNKSFPTLKVAPVYTEDQCQYVFLCGGALIPIGFAESCQSGENNVRRDPPFLSESADSAMYSDGSTSFLPRIDLTLDIRPAILPWA